MSAAGPSRNRILIIRFSSLGDIILTTLLQRVLRNRFPQAFIAMLTKPQYYPLLEGMPALDERLRLPLSSENTAAHRKLLKQSRFDTVIDLQNNILSRRLAKLIKPKTMLRFHRSRLNRWMRIHLPGSRKKLKTPPHVALSYVQTAQNLVLQGDEKGLELIIESDWIIQAKQLSGLEEGGEKTLIVAPGARHATKKWHSEGWTEVLKTAYDDGYRQQIIVGSDQDANVSGQIDKSVRHEIIDLTGKTNLTTLAAVIELGDVLITNDSGPMHIASAVGTPVVSIFGPTVPEFGFAPFRCRSEIVQVKDLPCRPCHPHGPDACPLDHFKCMREISPAMVTDALKRVLSEAHERFA